MLGAKSFIVVLTVSLLPFGPLTRIQKAIKKNDFEKATELIVKGYEKEPSNPGVYYLHAKLLFTKPYDFYDPDSAKLTIIKADELWRVANEDLRNKLTEERINKHVIDSLSVAIRDYFFANTIQMVSKEKINTFLAQYPETIYDDILSYKMDSLEFLEAKQTDTQNSYLKYINDHPTSVFNIKADSLLDFLRYDELKQEGFLSDYYTFRSSYPSSHYLYEVEAYILKISTASHRVKDLEKFIREAKTEGLKKKAKNMLFFLDKDHQALKSDSLENIKKLDNEVLFPVNDNGYFGFINSNGDVQIDFKYHTIQDRIRCNAVTDNWIYVADETGGHILLKNGLTILSEVEDYKYVSGAVGLIKKSSKWYAYHKSGFRIMEDEVESIEIFDNQWMKVYQNGNWGLFTLLGVPIAEAKYDDIYQLGDFWVFEKSSRLAVYTEKQILKKIEEKDRTLAFEFDDLELVNQEILMGFKGNRECLLDAQLQFLIPWGEYEIFPDPAGWYLRFDGGYALYNNSDERITKQDYRYLESNEGWLALQTENDWILLPRTDYLSPSRNYDSIKLISPHSVLLFEGKNKKVLFSKGKEIELNTHQIRSFLNHPEFIEINKGGALSLYNREGVSVFEGRYEGLTFLTDTTLKVVKNGKVGVISTKGDFILNPIFDSIDEKEGLILTLYRGKIGCYDLATKTLISPFYTTSISAIGSFYYTKKGNFYGLIDANEKEVLPFRFDEISYWNDTSYLVKAEHTYYIVNSSEENLSDAFSGYDLLYKDEEERIFKYAQNGKFGLRSDKNGELLKPEFTEIFEIGTDAYPVFFADQHLSHAGYHVVSYINQAGDLIYSNAYRKEEFEEVICND